MERLSDEALYEIADKLECWRYARMTREYTRTLYRLACESNGAILEIGAGCGRSLSILGLGAQVSEQLVTGIDQWRPSGYSGRIESGVDLANDIAECVRHLDMVQVRDRVRLVIARTSEARDIINAMCWGLVHVDGCHTYGGVACDVAAIERSVLMGGKIIFHDSGKGDAPRPKDALDCQTVQAVDEAIDDWQQRAGKLFVPVDEGVPERVFVRKG